MVKHNFLPSGLMRVACCLFIVRVVNRMCSGKEFNVRPDSLSPVITTTLEQARAPTSYWSVRAADLDNSQIWEKKIQAVYRFLPESVGLPTRSFVEAWTQRRPTQQPALDEVGLFGDTVSHYGWQPPLCPKIAFNKLDYLSDIGL